jgi:hypothetical protein
MQYFLKALIIGNIFVVVMWIAIVIVFWRRSIASARQAGASGLIATAGGWTELLHRPFVIVLLMLAFGTGIYLTTRG